MQAVDNDTIKYLNIILKSKLTSINQYFLHARMLKHRGELALADHEYKASIDAMKHADMLVEHILGLGGVPNLQELGGLSIGDDSTSIMQGDLKLAEAARAELKTTLAFCESRGNHATAVLLRKILDNQQEHIRFICHQINPETVKDCA